MISVIIPVFNAERFIEKSVISAIDQPEVTEIVMVEDGSTDPSYEICKKIVNRYAGRVKLYRHGEGKNKGAGCTRNLGIAKATRNYISFLDADDFFLDNRFRNDFRIFDSESVIDGVYNALGSFVYDITEQNRNLEPLTTMTHRVSPELLFDEMAPIGRSGYFHGDTLTVRRNVFDKVGYFDTSLELSQDTHMWMKMAAKLSLVPGIIDRPVAMRGVHSGNRVKDSQRFMYYRPLLFVKFLRWADRNDIPIERKLRVWENALKFQWDYLHSLGVSKMHKKLNLIGFGINNILQSPYLIKNLNYFWLYLRR